MRLKSPGDLGGAPPEHRGVADNDGMVIDMGDDERERRQAILDEARATLARTAEVSEPIWRSRSRAPSSIQWTAIAANWRHSISNWRDSVSAKPSAEAVRMPGRRAHPIRPSPGLARSTATLASETAAEFDRLNKLVAKLTKRIEAIEHKPHTDVASMQRTVDKLDATCAQLQSTMTRYFDASSAAEIVNLPARRVTN